MDNTNTATWEALKGVPDWAKKTIQGGRLKGMTDIKPQWRYDRLTSVFGPCGIGWKYTVDQQWLEEGANGERAAFVNISLYVKISDQWSHAIPGSGGSMFIAKEKSGLYTSDEAFKMATTDALGTAAKMLGLAADVYMGGDYSDSKYSGAKDDVISADQAKEVSDLLTETKADVTKFLKYIGSESVEKMINAQYQKALTALKAKKAGK